MDWGGWLLGGEVVVSRRGGATWGIGVRGS